MSDPFALSETTPVYVISVAAELSGLHAQTLRQYDRLGLVSPGRAAGGGRRYSALDIERLREVQRLSGDGVGLAGIKRILELTDQVAALQQRVRELQDEVDGRNARRRELVPLPGATGALVVWRPAPR
ncbi:MAG: helix-turn-helix transcriptional regulator [Candidatus Nanopelagicales bacterium]